MCRVTRPFRDDPSGVDIVQIDEVDILAGTPVSNHRLAVVELKSLVNGRGWLTVPGRLSLSSATAWAFHYEPATDR